MWANPDCYEFPLWPQLSSTTAHVCVCVCVCVRVRVCVCAAGVQHRGPVWP